MSKTVGGPTQSIEQSLCPFCQASNACMANTKSACWCFQVKVPQELRNLLPVDKQNTACICNDCITQFNQNQQAFSLNLPASFLS